MLLLCTYIFRFFRQQGLPPEPLLRNNSPRSPLEPRMSGSKEKILYPRLRVILFFLSQFGIPRPQRRELGDLSPSLSHKRGVIVTQKNKSGIGSDLTAHADEIETKDKCGLSFPHFRFQQSSLDLAPLRKSLDIFRQCKKGKTSPTPLEGSTNHDASIEKKVPHPRLKP